MSTSSTPRGLALADTVPSSAPGGRPRPRWLSSGTAGALIYVVAALAIFFGGSDNLLYQGALVAIYAIVTVSQEWLFGRAGLVSLGPAAIMAVGAFTTARLSEHGWGVFPVPLLVSFVFGCVIGLLIGIPGLRFSGLYLMLTTLALQFIVSFAAQKYQGLDHLAGFSVEPAHWGSLDLSTPQAMFAISAVILGLVLAGLYALYRGVPGRIWNAIRQDEAAASVLGVNLVRWKLTAFVGSSALTAVGGSLYAYQAAQVTYASYSLELSLALVVMVFIGGVGTLTGPVLGALVIVLLPLGVDQLAGTLSGSGDLASWLTLHQAVLANAIYGLVLLLVLLFERDGIFGLLRRLARAVVALARRLRPETEGGSR